MRLWTRCNRLWICEWLSCASAINKKRAIILHNGLQITSRKGVVQSLWIVTSYICTIELRLWWFAYGNCRATGKWVTCCSHHKLQVKCPWSIVRPTRILMMTMRRPKYVGLLSLYSGVLPWTTKWMWMLWLLSSQRAKLAGLKWTLGFGHCCTVQKINVSILDNKVSRKVQLRANAVHEVLVPSNWKECFPISIRFGLKVSDIRRRTQ